MSKPYQKECIFCKTKITMSDEKGSWRPFNLDGAEHDCKKKKNGNGNGNNDISLEVVLKKLKTVGITLDLQVLRNAVNGDVK